MSQTNERHEHLFLFGLEYNLIQLNSISIFNILSYKTCSYIFIANITSIGSTCIKEFDKYNEVTKKDIFQKEYL